MASGTMAPTATYPIKFVIDKQALIHSISSYLNDVIIVTFLDVATPTQTKELIAETEIVMLTRLTRVQNCFGF